MVNVLNAEEYQRPYFNEMINTAIELINKYNIGFENSSHIFVDGANPSFIRALRDRVNEDEDYEQQIIFYKKNYPSVYDFEFLQQNMFIIPVRFNKEHKHMLAHCNELMEYHNGFVGINPRFNKLITSLMTTVESG